MPHPNEAQLRRLYALFAQGDIAGFLGGCTVDATFTVPGNAVVSGEYSTSTFMELIAPVMEHSGGTFEEHVLDVFANDEHGALLLHHQFTRLGLQRAYRTAHIVEFQDGLVARWTEHPGSMREFEEAWGTR